MKKNVVSMVFLFAIIIASSVSGFEVPIKIFPLDNYDQIIESWIKPSDPDYDELLISVSKQEKMHNEFYKHYYSTSNDDPSPWNDKYVEQILKNKLPILSEKTPIVSNGDYINFDTTADHYGANYLKYTNQWLQQIITNMNLNQFKNSSLLNDRKLNRGITTKNLLARSLPTIDPVFSHLSMPGEGLPFDNLSESSVWIGTPVYVIAKSIDEQWSMILTPHFIAWVQSDGIAKVNDDFIKKWQEKAKANMVAITRTNISVFDTKKQYQFNAYVGTVLPCASKNNDDNNNKINILIPVADHDQNAQIIIGEVNRDDAAIMPLAATPHNFSAVMSTLLGRPYGWGGMYFYNDCSAELQNFYVPFGIWLPRDSSKQAKVGRVVDKTSETVEERIKYLKENGKKFITMVHICGHIMLYTGNYPSVHHGFSESVPMTYQNMWGLRPADNSYRSVVGKSVLFPLLMSYPEDLKLLSLAGRKCFQIIYLDGLASDINPLLKEEL